MPINNLFDNSIPSSNSYNITPSDLSCLALVIHAYYFVCYENLSSIHYLFDMKFTDLLSTFLVFYQPSKATAIYFTYSNICLYPFEKMTFH
jgi:hypothetical protein